MIDELPKTFFLRKIKKIIERNLNSHKRTLQSSSLTIATLHELTMYLHLADGHELLCNVLRGKNSKKNHYGTFF